MRRFWQVVHHLVAHPLVGLMDDIEVCDCCGTALIFGDNIYEDMVEHWYCPNEDCPMSDMFMGEI